LRAKGEYGALPQRMAGAVAEIFRSRLAPGACEHRAVARRRVTVDQSAANRRAAISS
jgi:hypothetical protein